MYRHLVNEILYDTVANWSIADLRNYAPEIRGHSKYTKIQPTKNFGDIADSRKYAPEIRGHSIGLCILIDFAFHRSTLILLTVLRFLSYSVRSSN